MNILLKFDSIQQLDHYLDGKPTQAGANEYADKWSPDQTNNFTLQSAIDCAKQGGAWAEGARDLSAVAFSPDATFEAQAASFESSVSGCFPNVQNAIIGLPDAMFNQVKKSQPKKHIRIMVNGAVAHNVKPQQALNRGRAILAVIERLELIGYQVELYVCFYSRLAEPRLNFRTEVRIKALNEAPNLPVTAFCLCSTAFTRRLSMRLMEVTKEAAPFTHQSYGYPNDVGRIELAGIDVYFRLINPLSDQWRTPDRARQYVLEEVKKQMR